MKAVLEKLSNDIILTKVTSASDFIEIHWQNYFVHLLCKRGKANISINEKPFELNKSCLLILLPEFYFKLLNCDEKFEAVCFSVSFDLMSKNNPDIGWGIKGYMFSKENPVVRLTKTDVGICLDNFKTLLAKYKNPNHLFQSEIINHQLKIFVMDMWNIFSSEIEKRNVSVQKGNLFERFLQLAQHHCMEMRMVEFYAEKLFITPKYLTEICKKASGKTPSQWIENYTTQHLILLLQNSQLSFSEIADTLHFSSLSFFSRYVKKVLGVSPSDYRNRLLGL